MNRSVTVTMNSAVACGATDATIAARPAPEDLWRWARACWQRLRQISRSAPRRLRLCESLPLGERRFVAVVEFEGARFLVGGTSASLVLLARLENGVEQIASPQVEPAATCEEIQP